MSMTAEKLQAKIAELTSESGDPVATRVEFWLERRRVEKDGPGPWRNPPGGGGPHRLPPLYSMIKAIMDDRGWTGKWADKYEYRIVRYVVSGVVVRHVGIDAPEPEILPDAE